MSAIALTGALTLLLPARWLDRLINPLVAVAAGSLVGGALFHLLPEAVAHSGNIPSVYGWFALGFLASFFLSSSCTGITCTGRAGAANLWGISSCWRTDCTTCSAALRSGGTFLIDPRVGVVAWFVAATHEVPQELGDFGVLISRGWGKRQALLFNLLSGLTFLVRALLAYAASGSVDVDLLVLFAAGNFLYIAASDLLPELRQPLRLGEKLTLTGLVTAAASALFVVALLAG